MGNPFSMAWGIVGIFCNGSNRWKRTSERRRRGMRDLGWWYVYQISNRYASKCGNWQWDKYGQWLSYPLPHLLRTLYTHQFPTSSVSKKGPFGLVWLSIRVLQCQPLISFNTPLSSWLTRSHRQVIELRTFACFNKNYSFFCVEFKQSS